MVHANLKEEHKPKPVNIILFRGILMNMRKDFNNSRIRSKVDFLCCPLTKGR